MKKIFSVFSIWMIFFIYISNFSYVKASVESWYITDSMIKGYKPVLRTENNFADNKINESINHYIYDQSIYFRNMGYNKDINFDYVITFEDNDAISLLMITKSYGNKKTLKTYHGLSFNKNNGERYRLSDFLKITSQNIEYISKQCYYDVSTSVVSHKISDYNFIKTKLYSPITKVSNDFFLLGNGEIALIYPPIGNVSNKEFSVIRLERGQVTYFNYTNKSIRGDD